MFSNDDNLKKSSFIVIIIFLAALLISLMIFAFKIGKSNEGETEYQKQMNGKSAYEIALEYGYTGTLEDFNKSLVGGNGSDGKTAYEIAIESGYFTGSIEEWEEFIKGSNGVDGLDGKTLFEYAKENGFTGTADEFSELLIKIAEGGTMGEDGKSGEDGIFLESFNCVSKDEIALSLYTFNLSDGSTILKIKDNFGEADEIIDIFPLYFPSGINVNQIKMYATAENEYDAVRTYQINNTDSRISDGAYADFSRLNSMDTHHSQQVKIELNGVTTNVDVRFYPKEFTGMYINSDLYEDEFNEYTSRLNYTGILGERTLIHPLIDDLNGEKIEDFSFLGNAQISNNINALKSLKYGKDFKIVGDNENAIKRSTYKDIEAPNGFKVVFVKLCLATYEYDSTTHSYVKSFDDTDESSIINALFYETVSNDIVLMNVINDDNVAIIFDRDLESGKNLFENSFGYSRSYSLKLTKIYIDGRVEEVPVLDEFLNFETTKEEYVSAHFNESLNKQIQTISTIDFNSVKDISVPLECHTEFESDSYHIDYAYLYSDDKDNCTYDYYLSYEIGDSKVKDTKNLFIKRIADGSFSNGDFKNFKCTVNLAFSSFDAYKYRVELSFDEFIDMLEIDYEYDSDRNYYDAVFNFEKTINGINFNDTFDLEVYIYDLLNEYIASNTNEEYYNISNQELESIDILYYKAYGLYIDGVHIYDITNLNSNITINTLHLDSSNFDDYILNDYDFETPGLKTLIIKTVYDIPLMLHITLIDNSDNYIKNSLIENILITQRVGDNIADLLNYLRKNAANLVNFNNYSPIKNYMSAVYLNYDMFEFDIPVDESGAFTTTGLYTIKINDYITNITSEINLEVVEPQGKKNIVCRIQTTRSLPAVFAQVILFFDDNTCDFCYEKKIDSDIGLLYQNMPIRTATYEKVGNTFTINDECFGVISFEIEGEECERVSLKDSKDIKESYSFLENDTYTGITIFNDNRVVIENLYGNSINFYFEFYIDDDLKVIGSHEELQKIEYELNGVSYYIFDSIDVYNFMQVIKGRR